MYVEVIRMSGRGRARKSWEDLIKKRDEIRKNKGKKGKDCTEKDIKRRRNSRNNATRWKHVEVAH